MKKKKKCWKISAVFEFLDRQVWKPAHSEHVEKGIF